MRYLLAIEEVKRKSKQLNLTDEQKSQLREREATEQAATESALLRLYMEVWLPRVEEGGLNIEKVPAGGRPLQTTLNEKKMAMIHERVMELLSVFQQRVFPTVKPGKIVELFKLGEGVPPALGIRTAEVVDGFYSFLGFTRLTTIAAIRKGIAEGIQKDLFGYVAGTVPALGSDGKYQVPIARVRVGVQVAEDEVDLDSGFLMMPEAIPQPVTPPAPGATPAGPGGVGGSTGPGPTPPGPPPPLPPGPGVQKLVELAFTADRDQLFTAWNALANLADLAGKVRVAVRAESEAGFDRTRLQNGVIEPLKEADLIE